MSFADELQRYLALGMDLQHRRPECHRRRDGKQYQTQWWEERIRWKQEVLVTPDEILRFPATWEFLPGCNLSWHHGNSLLDDEPLVLARRGER